MTQNTKRYLLDLRAVRIWCASSDNIFRAVSSSISSGDVLLCNTVLRELAVIDATGATRVKATASVNLRRSRTHRLSTSALLDNSTVPYDSTYDGEWSIIGIARSERVIIVSDDVTVQKFYSKFNPIKAISFEDFLVALLLD